jgi:hypothetical protein
MEACHLEWLSRMVVLLSRMVHAWMGITPPRLTFQTSLLDTPSKRSLLLHLVAVFPAIHPNRLYCLYLQIKSHLRGGLFIQSTPHIDLVDRRPQLKIVSRRPVKIASANPQDGYVSKWMCNLVCVLAGNKKIKSYEVAYEGMKAS